MTKDYGYLQTEKSYKDFQMSLRFKCEGDGNSGVFFHTWFKPGTADVTKGPQFEIDCTLGKHTGGVYEQKRGWIVWPAPENESVVRLGGLERVSADGGGQPLHRAAERRDHGGLHGSEAGERRRADRAAIAFGRPREYAIQGHYRSRPVARR